MKAEDRIVKTTEENYHNTLEERLAEQDKISFKAGIKEVVDWCNERYVAIYDGEIKDNLLSEDEEWQAQKKEWGIE